MAENIVPWQEILRPEAVEAAKLLAQGKIGSEIAVIVGVTFDTVFNWAWSPAFREAVRHFHEETHRLAVDEARASGELK